MANELSAISPIDGRYAKTTQALQSFFSEGALMKYRVQIEIEYFIALCEFSISPLANFSSNDFTILRKIYQDFSTQDEVEIKKIEEKINHDVKAIEYFIKNKFIALGWENYQEMIHFGLTSQDINNTAIPLSIKEALQQIYLPELKNLESQLSNLAQTWENIPMLAFTHGQAASPTRLGKEIKVFAERLQIQILTLENISHTAKFGGATGNLNAHYVTFPDKNWIAFANNFVNKKLGLNRSQTTTQVEHYDQFAAQCDALKRINTILLDLSRDIWLYISKNYFKQKINPNEVGSSAMPHKVNPIDFENAEGNLGLANAMLEHFSAKLPISRLQRDLSDSTVLRNIGVPFAHGLIAFNSLKKGLNKLLVNENHIKDDLNNNWAVVAEAIQSILRRENYPSPYETLKDLTRKNEEITQKTLHLFIDNLKIDAKIKEEMKKITPYNYLGII